MADHEMGLVGPDEPDADACGADNVRLRAENARYREALAWMASFTRTDLDHATTLHYDMNARARRELGREPPRAGT